MNTGLRFASVSFSGCFKLLAVGFVCLGLTTVSCWAQTATAGTVTGQVVDEQNAVVPGTSVKIVEPSTNATQVTVANEAGRYIFSQVPPGVYNMIFTKEGFATFEVNAQTVAVGEVLTINAKLKIGATATTVEVTATTGAELVTMNATVGNTLEKKALENLPNMGRDVSTLAVLQPGVTMGGYTAGSHNEQNTFILDGGNITDDMAGNTTGYQTNFTGFGGTQTNGTPSGVITVPLESVEEMRVSTINQTSDFANSSGSQVQMVTKRGTNQFHGAAYLWYFDTTIGAANTWTANHTPATVNGIAYQYTPIVSNHRTRYGAALGGPLTPKDFLGKKWYFYFNYEALRFPNVGSYNRIVPSDLLRAGVIQLPNSAGVYQAYNINPSPVTVDGTVYQPATCPIGACDPRGIGISPVISTIWNKQMPLANNVAVGDGYNTQGYLSTIRAPQSNNAYVGRIDHDINDRFRWYGTYRDQKLTSLTTNQVDVGGVLSGDVLGQPTAKAPRPQQPSFWATGLTTTISSTKTNNFVFNYTRTFWQWGSQNAPPQLPGLGGAVEIGGESTSALIPYNINTQSVRQRFWDGQDKLVRDDFTMIHGNHLFGIGGAYQRNFDYHQRTDNGNGINNALVYQVTNSGINIPSASYLPTTIASSSASTWNTYYAEILGMVNQPQVAYTRTGSNLTLQPIGSAAFDKDVIPYYSTYFYDTWHVKPALTVTYGIGWNLEMPPYELTGKQVMLVDPSGNAFSTQSFISQREQAALSGNPATYTPELGFALVGNVAGGGRKYPYDPYYKEFSPRAAFAWQPHFGDGILGKIFGNGKTVVRGGYARIFGRLNGVNLVLSPLLGVGLIQAVTCQGASMSGQCLGTNNVDPTSAFRIGVDGMSAPMQTVSQTLPQPFYPGVGANATAGDASVLDPAYRPDRTDQFTATIQREINSHMSLEVGYIGKILRNETTEVDLDAVPYMTTLGGQTFAQAYSNIYWQIWQGASANAMPTQAWFETAMGGANSAYCTGFASCTAAVASKNASLFKNTQVSDLWQTLSKATGWTLGRTMLSSAIPGGAAGGQGTSLSMSGSLGWGNYNALFATFRTNDYHGVTVVSNFTYGRALGTGVVSQSSSAYTAENMFDLHASYGPNSFDYKFVYNIAMYYQPSGYRSQRGVVGHLLGGWTFSPLFTAQSGAGIEPAYTEVNCSACQALGEVGNTAASDSSIAEGAVGFKPYTGTSSLKYGVFPTDGVGNKNPNYGLNMFSSPSTVLSEFRPCVLGFDTSCGGYYNLRGLPTWNIDAAIAKDIGIHKESVGATLYINITNLLNHFQANNPSLTITSPTSFGQITGQANTPRNMEFGIRVHF
ncbi:MAG TPA: carboxypeptidase-like regulatory domain-containing protein [Bryobacteraceae bacterium]|nr:carboxypeptidase-like regulatory domain-containing protein [Bryobacteraceae bacterium]